MSMDLMVFGLALGISGLVSFLLSKWYLWPWLAARPTEQALTVILWPQAFRYLNLANATTSQVGPLVPRPWIAEVAWGDFAAAVLALIAIAALRSKSGAWRGLVWLATVVGLLDFCNSLGQGGLIGTAELPLGNVWYIATCLVPPLFAAHILAIKLLLRDKP